MKQNELKPDEAIDRVLTGLREVEPLQGMQQRTLRLAQERASARGRWTLQLPLTAKYSWAVASATVAGITLAVSWMILRDHRTIHDIAHTPAHPQVSNAPVAETYLSSAPIARPRLAHEARLSAPAQHAEPAEPASNEDGLALSEMKAPSHPAPPMPLTEQEKLLVRLIHKGDPVELAMLDPKMRSSEEADGNADFERFFAPPKPIVTTPPVLDSKPTTGEDK